MLASPALAAAAPPCLAAALKSDRTDAFVPPAELGAGSCARRQGLLQRLEGLRAVLACGEVDWCGARYVRVRHERTERLVRRELVTITEPEGEADTVPALPTAVPAEACRGVETTGEPTAFYALDREHSATPEIDGVDAVARGERGFACGRHGDLLKVTLGDHWGFVHRSQLDLTDDRAEMGYFQWTGPFCLRLAWTARITRATRAFPPRGAAPLEQAGVLEEGRMVTVTAVVPARTGAGRFYEVVEGGGVTLVPEAALQVTGMFDVGSVTAANRLCPATAAVVELRCRTLAIDTREPGFTVDLPEGVRVPRVVAEGPTRAAEVLYLGRQLRVAMSGCLTDVAQVARVGDAHPGAIGRVLEPAEEAQVAGAIAALPAPGGPEPSTAVASMVRTLTAPYGGRRVDRALALASEAGKQERLPLRSFAALAGAAAPESLLRLIVNGPGPVLTRLERRFLAADRRPPPETRPKTARRLSFGDLARRVTTPALRPAVMALQRHDPDRALRELLSAPVTAPAGRAERAVLRVEALLDLELPVLAQRAADVAVGVSLRAGRPELAEHALERFRELARDHGYQRAGPTVWTRRCDALTTGPVALVGGVCYVAAAMAFEAFSRNQVEGLEAADGATQDASWRVQALRDLAAPILAVLGRVPRRSADAARAQALTALLNADVREKGTRLAEGLVDALRTAWRRSPPRDAHAEALRDRLRLKVGLAAARAGEAPAARRAFSRVRCATLASQPLEVSQALLEVGAADAGLATLAATCGPTTRLELFPLRSVATAALHAAQCEVEQARRGIARAKAELRRLVETAAAVTHVVRTERSDPDRLRSSVRRAIGRQGVHAERAPLLESAFGPEAPCTRADAVTTEWRRVQRAERQRARLSPRLRAWLVAERDTARAACQTELVELPKRLGAELDRVAELIDVVSARIDGVDDEQQTVALQWTGRIASARTTALDADPPLRAAMQAEPRCAGALSGQDDCDPRERTWHALDCQILASLRCATALAGDAPALADRWLASDPAANVAQPRHLLPFEPTRFGSKGLVALATRALGLARPHHGKCLASPP